MNFRKCKKIAAVFLAVALVGTSCFTEFPTAFADDGNLALNKKVYSGGEFNSAFAATNAVDGVTGTHFASGSEKADAGIVGRAIVVDLGQEYDIDTVKIITERDMDRGGYSRSGWSVYISKDFSFENATLIGTKKSPGNFGEDFEVELEKPIRGRYVKLASTSMIVISEIEVYGELPKAGADNGYSLKEYSDLDADDAANLVPYLGILEGVTDKEFQPLSLLKRKEAVKSVLAVINFKTTETENFFEDVNENDEYCPYINSALSMGIVSASNEFRPDDYITVAEFYAMILRALGYGEYASAVAAYPAGVLKAAARIGLDDDAALNGNDLINRNSALHIIYNALMSSVMEETSISSKGAAYDFGGDKETVLEKYFNMELFSGIVTANNATTLNDLVSGAAGSIAVGDKTYNDLTASAYGAIGKNICYLVDSDNDNNIISWWENSAENKTYEIDCGYVEAVSKSTIKCYADETTPKRSFNITNAVILRNGAACYDYTYDLSSFKPSDSYLVLTDNDSDGTIDVVNIMQPAVVPIDNMEIGDDEITLIGKGGESVKIEDYDNMDVLINGAKGRRRSLNNSAVVYAYAASNGKNILIDGYTTVVEKKIESIGDDCVTIDGTEYEFSDYYLENKDKMGKLEVGASPRCAIGKDNKLVWIYDDGGIVSPENLGFIAQPDSKGDKMSFRVFTENAEFVTLKLANKLTVDGVSIKADDIDDNPELISRKFAIYKLDSENRIKWIDTENYDPATEPDSNMKKVEGVSADSCRSHANAIFDGNKMLFPVKDNMKVFVIPYSHGKIMTSSEYEKYYNITEYSKTFSTYGVLIDSGDTFYNQDKNGFPLFVSRGARTYDDVVSNVYSPCTSKYAPVMVVTKITRSLNANSDGAYCISGYDFRNGSKIAYNTNGMIKKCVNTAKIFADNITEYIDSGSNKVKPTTIANEYLDDINSIKAGDILKYETVDNMIVGLEKIIDRDKISEYRFGEEVSYPHTSYRYLCADVISIDNGLITYEGQNGVEVRECGKFKVCFTYESGRDGKGEVSAISPSKMPSHFKSGQKCVVYLNVGRVVSVILYE